MSIIPCLRTSFIALHIALASAILIQTLLFVNPLRANRQKKKEKEEEEEEEEAASRSNERCRNPRVYSSRIFGGTYFKKIQRA
jgi:hypothetical protein